MDLYKYLQFCKNNNIINVMKNGFECSDFVKNAPESKDLVKKIINKLLENPRVRIGLQVTTGGLLKNQNKTKTPQKANDISYTSELNIMLSNLIGLLGFELSYSLTVLYNLNNIIKLYIDKIKNVKEYCEIIKYVKNIRNIYAFNSESIIVNESFDSCFSEQEFSFEMSLDSDIFDTKTKFFNNLIADIENNEKANNYNEFDDKVELYYSELSTLYENTIFDSYEINNVDQLLINIDKEVLKKPYDGWFMKLWEILNQEANIDYPIKNSSKVACEEYILNKLELNVNTQTLITEYMEYFKLIEIETKKTIFYDNSENSNVLNVITTDEFYKQLAHITLNFYTILAKTMADNQMFCSIFSKATRVHFLLMFYSVVCNVKPRLYDYTDTQIGILHYVLLSKNTLTESVKIMEKTDQPATKKK